jgi:hypothetical protein
MTKGFSKCENKMDQQASTLETCLGKVQDVNY